MAKDWWEGLDPSGGPSLITTTDPATRGDVWHLAWIADGTAYRVRVEGPAMETHPLTPAAKAEWERIMGRR